MHVIYSTVYSMSTLGKLFMHCCIFCIILRLKTIVMDYKDDILVKTYYSQRLRDIKCLKIFPSTRHVMAVGRSGGSDQRYDLEFYYSPHLGD